MATSIKHDQDLRNYFQQEALDSWKRYQETGLHLTGKEVRDWLNDWHNSYNKEIPLCHK